MIRRPPRSTLDRSSAASDVYKRQLLPGADRDLVNYLSMRIKKSFAEVMTKSKVLEMKEVKEGISVKIEDEKGNVADKVYDYVLMSIGRKPETRGLGLENTKVSLTDRGWIKVDKQLRTTDPNIFAIGDIAGEPMLAHKACLLYTSPSPRDRTRSRMPSSA